MLQVRVSSGSTLREMREELQILKDKRMKRGAWSCAEEARLDALVRIPENLAYARILGQIVAVYDKYYDALKDLKEFEAAWSHHAPQSPKKLEGAALLGGRSGPNAADPSAGAQLTNNNTCIDDITSKNSVASSRRRVPDGSPSFKNPGNNTGREAPAPLSRLKNE